MGITSSQPADEVDFGTSSSESGMKTTFEIFWNPVPFHPFLSSLYLRKSMNSAEECFICIALSQDSTRSIVRHSKWTRKNLQTLNVTPALTFPCSRMLFFYTRLFIFVDTRWYEYVEGQGVQLAPHLIITSRLPHAATNPRAASSVETFLLARTSIRVVPLRPQYIWTKRPIEADKNKPKRGVIRCP